MHIQRYGRGGKREERGWMIPLIFPLEKGNQPSRLFSGFSPWCDQELLHQQWFIVYSAAALSSHTSGDPDEESGQESHSFLSFFSFIRLKGINKQLKKKKEKRMMSTSTRWMKYLYQPCFLWLSSFASDFRSYRCCGSGCRAAERHYYISELCSWGRTGGDACGLPCFRFFDFPIIVRILSSYDFHVSFPRAFSSASGAADSALCAQLWAEQKLVTWELLPQQP